MAARPCWVTLLAFLSVAVAGCGGVVAEPGDEPRSLERYGIRVALPDGWHGRLTRATVEAATVPLGPLGKEPPLETDDIALRLFEFEPDPDYYSEADLERSYAKGLLRPFTAEEFTMTELGGDNPRNPGFARRNFVLAGRYFDLFVESGTPHPESETMDRLNELVSSLQVQAGDFYPGRIEPPRFPGASGWHVGSAGGGEVRAADYAEAWASTVPYRNGPRDLPPSRTLETLPADGILIWVGLARDNRFPPTAEPRVNRPPVHVPLKLSDAHGCACFEGVPENWLYRLYGPVGEHYDIDLWVFFGRADEPSAEERTRAQAMLDRLQLPEWGPWELDGRGEVVS